jgi:hypothetical protein
LILCTFFLSFHFIDFGLYYYCFFPSASFGFRFSRSLQCSTRSLIWDHSVFLIYALMKINFPPRNAFAVFYRFW